MKVCREGWKERGSEGGKQGQREGEREKKGGRKGLKSSESDLVVLFGWFYVLQPWSSVSKPAHPRILTRGPRAPAV